MAEGPKSNLFETVKGTRDEAADVDVESREIGVGPFGMFKRVVTDWQVSSGSAKLHVSDDEPKGRIAAILSGGPYITAKLTVTTFAPTDCYKFKIDAEITPGATEADGTVESSVPYGTRGIKRVDSPFGPERALADFESVISAQF